MNNHPLISVLITAAVHLLLASCTVTPDTPSAPAQGAKASIETKPNTAPEQKTGSEQNASAPKAASDQKQVVTKAESAPKASSTITSSATALPPQSASTTADTRSPQQSTRTQAPPPPSSATAAAVGSTSSHRTQTSQAASEQATSTPPPAPESTMTDNKQAEAVARTPTTVEFNLEQLPLTIANTWVLHNDLDYCSLHSATGTLEDGAGQTPATLVLTPNHWTLVTKSDIDPSYSGTGLTLDTGVHFAVEDVVNDTNVQFNQQSQPLTDSLSKASSVTIALGFWPTWPVSETRSVTISVKHFDRAYQAWQTCNQQLNAR